MSQLDTPSSKSEAGYHSYFSSKVTLSDEPILLTINLVLQTAFLKSSAGKPISLLLIGEAGLGKSRILSCIEQVSEASYVNDITPKYLVEFLEQVKKKEKKFLVIPDFISCTSHSKSTRNTLIAILRSMTEEGVTNLSDYHLEFKSDEPIRAGLITAITKSSQEEFARSWKRTGFLSRLLPFSFNHSPTTRTRIMNDIDEGKKDTLSLVKINVNRRPPVTSGDSQLLRQLRAYEELLSSKTQSAPYRHQIQLNRLVEASAVLRNDNKVTQLDIDTIHRLSNWINYDFKEL